MNICNFLYNRKLINEQEIRIIDYGLKVIFFNLISIFSIILISLLLFRNILYGIIFLSVFIPIRIISGGYHCKTALRCAISFNSIYIVMHSLICNIQYDLFIIFFLSIILLFIPIHINEQKKHLTGKKQKLIKPIIILLIVVVNLLNNKVIFLSTICAHLINIILLVLAHIQSFYKKNRQVQL